MALTVHTLLAALALLFAVASLVPWPTYRHELLTVAVLLLAVSALVP